MPLGRPTDYNETILEKSKDYLASCKDTLEVEIVNDRPTQKLKVKIPTKGGLASYLDVSRDTLYEWAKVHPAFSDIMERLSSEQEDRLINNGLAGTYNPTIAKVLMTKHGYSDKLETDVTSGGKPIAAITGMNISKDSGQTNQ